VAGEAEELAALVARAPAIVRACSPFGHHRTLLQHVAANGIESSRQWQSPSNAVEIARILIEAGADVDAPSDGPAGGWTALTLLVTSEHPAKAGVQADLVEVLCRAGAKPDGIEDDGKPLWEAINFYYTPAVDRLVRCGARVDNLIFAAAVGDRDAVSRYFDAEGKLDLDRARDWGRARLPGLGRDHLLEYALIHAAAHGRREVVELLLSKGPDLTVREPFWSNTALDGAEYSRHTAIAALIAAAAAAASRG
jgi:ankyrin repeat protein